LLLPDGTVGVLMPDGPVLPVTEADRVVARTATGTTTHDAEFGGETYEILTKPRPGGGAVMVGQRVDGPELIDDEFRWRTCTITALA
ncbi:hypothetical protein, partial [Nocardia farcinica]|uniref:hypothetical protein n=1 Tax=Nocardia farcinica TaxID=37329 RepID=UPI001C0EEB26